MTRPVDDAVLRQLQESLGRLSLGASVVASNLANVDTPGYRARGVRFAETLGRVRSLEMSRTEPGHIAPKTDAPARGEVYEADAKRVRQDGNTVDVDREMTALAAIQGRYNAATQIVRKRLALIRYAATDGKG
jgi:flagellar basal-body rod protein FlgB